MRTKLATGLGLWLLMAGSASAQDTTAEPLTAVETEPPTETAGAEEEKKDKDDKGVYRKKVKGLLWVEGTAAPSAYRPTSIKSVNVGGGLSLPKQNGPEYGAAVGVMLGSFTIGGRFKMANYDLFNLLTVGLDMGILINSIPYVHPLIKIALNYNGIRDAPGLQGDGGGVLLGAGVRIPIIKWISLAIAFDYSIIGMYLRSGGNKEGAAGSQLAGTFALTFHPF